MYRLRSKLKKMKAKESEFEFYMNLAFPFHTQSGYIYMEPTCVCNVCCCVSANYTSTSLCSHVSIKREKHVAGDCFIQRNQSCPFIQKMLEDIV